jgi:hypothetical protein
MAANSPIQPHDRKGQDLNEKTPRRTSRGTDESVWFEFRPARWLLAALVLLRLWLLRPTLGKRAILVLAWRFIPRRLKLIAGGVVVLGVFLVAGSIAALVVVLN